MEEDLLKRELKGKGHQILKKGLEEDGGDADGRENQDGFSPGTGKISEENRGKEVDETTVKGFIRKTS